MNKEIVVLAENNLSETNQELNWYKNMVMNNLPFVIGQFVHISRFYSCHFKTFKVNLSNYFESISLKMLNTWISCLGDVIRSATIVTSALPEF